MDLLDYEAKIISLTMLSFTLGGDYTKAMFGCRIDVQINEMGI